MTQIDENSALSILFANTKRKKRDVDLLTLSKNCEYLVNFYNGSQLTVAEKLGLSKEMIREFLIAKDLPNEIQLLISKRKIDSLDIVKQISEIKDPKNQIKIAYAVLDLPSKDIRDIKRLVKSSNIHAEEAKKTIQNEKPKNFHVYLIDIDDNENDIILLEAQKQKMKPAVLVKKIVIEWLNKKSKNLD